LLESKLYGRPQRFCSICGHKMLGYPSELRRHCNSQHSGRNEGFLKAKELPKLPKYTNFKEFLLDPNIELIEDPKYPKRQVGRPRKPLKKKAKHYMTKFMCGPPFQKRSRRWVSNRKNASK